MEYPWEDNLLERKVESDLKDLLPTMVAFANSVHPDHVAVILIGERDDGTVQGVTNADSIQKTIRKEAEKIYPAIIWRSTIYEKEQLPCVRVEIEYSGDTPHFGGIAWVRKGSETKKATDEMFQKLIELRMEKVRELSKWLDKSVTVWPELGQVPKSWRSDGGLDGNVLYSFRHRWSQRLSARLISVNNFWITLQKENGEEISEPITKVTLNFDDKNDCLQLNIDY